jgi:phospholipid/cholesterol/gamma-HCH transport system ATP-binding protein
MSAEAIEAKDAPAGQGDDPPPIEVRGLVSAFGDQVIHDHLDLTVNSGEVLGVVGGSGAGKSVLLNTIIGLKQPDGGVVKVFGQDINRSSDGQMGLIERRWGVLFQNGALFSNLTVRENVAAPFFEHTSMARADIYELADLKIGLTGLPPHAGDLKPAELSGGMRKRAALARALALDPDLLFLDEPTSGLDPISAGAFDELIGDLSESLGLTVFMITHDLDSLYAICDRVAVIADKKVVASGTIPELKKSPHPWIQEYFNGPRGRAAAQSEDGAKAKDAPDAIEKAEALSQDSAEKKLVKAPAGSPAKDHPKGAA